MNQNLTMQLKAYALELGADLVGIADVGRFANAPLMMSPQGLLPEARSVIVCAIHHPDAAIELGGETHPQEIGPYSIQYAMNSKLDTIAYHIANRVEALGYDAIPIASSNIWRYRNFMELKADFAPDLSHIYAAACAGLGQIVWNGLTLSPEYGPWNRFISIVTTAPLVPTPLYEESRLCDRCGECIRHCPTDAFRKEVRGVKSVDIVDGERTVSHKFCDKNLWRCAWGEHFDLDLDLEIPDVVDEQVLLDTIARHGMRGGEMGCCLKYCLPPLLRSPGGDFCSTYRRKTHTVATDLPVHRRVYDDVTEIARRWAADDVVFLGEEAVAALGAAKAFSPARGAVVYAIRWRAEESAPPEDAPYAAHGDGESVTGLQRPLGQAAGFFKNFINLDVARHLEQIGYRALCNSGADEASYAAAAGILAAPGESLTCGIVLADAAFAPRELRGLQAPALNPRRSLTQNLCALLDAEGSDLYAVVPAARMDALADRLEALKGGEEILFAKDKNPRFYPYEASVRAARRSLRRSGDCLPGARSVLLFALPFPQAVSRMTLQPPARAVGPYLFARYQSTLELSFTGLRLCKFLQGLGYRAGMQYDLCGLGGDIGSPRGFLPDAFCNSFEAAEAGLGQLAANGVCFTQAHGFSQQFMAIVTDAPLDAVCHAKKAEADVAERCRGCGICAAACPSGALQPRQAVELTLGGRTALWYPADWNRCDWAKKYALCGEEGHRYTGSLTQVEPPERITPEALRDALSQSDRVFKFRPTAAQRCVVDCPLQHAE